MADETDTQDVKPESEQDIGTPDSSLEQKIEGEPQADKRGPDGWIPKVRFNEVIEERNSLRAQADQEREERIRLEERLKAQTSERTEKDKRVPTRAELDGMVERGELTATQANEYMDEVTRRRSVSEALTIMERQAEQRRRAERRDNEMRSYAEVVPELAKSGSDTWKQAAQAYQDIVFYNGQPTSEDQKLTYELMAVRATLGPVGPLKARRDREVADRATRETYNEMGSGNPNKTDHDDAKLKKLTPKQQEHFKRMQAAGRYRGGIKEYMDELTFVPPRA